MINQLNREDGQPTPYFVRGPVGNTPEGVDGYITAHLTLDYRYVCSAHCRGLPIAPWFRPAAAVAPMLELDLAQQLAQDQAEFAAVPHPQLYPHEMVQWTLLYQQVMTYNPEEPQNMTPRQALRRLHGLAVARDNFWATQRVIAPAPPWP